MHSTQPALFCIVLIIGHRIAMLAWFHFLIACTVACFTILPCRAIGNTLFYGVARKHRIFRGCCAIYGLTTSSRGADRSISSRGGVVSLHRGGMAQSIITQVTKENEYTPCPAQDTGLSNVKAFRKSNNMYVIKFLSALVNLLVQC